MPTGIELIAQERREQIEKHNRSILYDCNENGNHQLVHAASGLLFTEDELSPMDLIMDFRKLENWNKEIIARMVNKPYKDRLIIAGALIAAELDRLIAVENNEEQLAELSKQ